MARQHAQTDKQPRSGGYVVRRPRATDAIAQSLHATYNAGGSLPKDIEALIARLDRIPPR